MVKPRTPPVRTVTPQLIKPSRSPSTPEFLDLNMFFLWIDTLDPKKYRALERIIMRLQQLQNIWYIRDLFALINQWRLGDA